LLTKLQFIFIFNFRVNARVDVYSYSFFGVVGRKMK